MELSRQMVGQDQAEEDGMPGQCAGTLYSLVVQEGLRYLCRAAAWTGGALGRELEQLCPGDPPSV